MSTWRGEDYCIDELRRMVRVEGVESKFAIEEIMTPELYDFICQFHPDAIYQISWVTKTKQRFYTIYRGEEVLRIIFRHIIPRWARGEKITPNKLKRSIGFKWKFLLIID